MKGNNKYTRSVKCIVFMITGNISIREMTTHELGLKSMENIDPMHLRMSFKAWEGKGLLSSGKTIEHASIYGTGLSIAENTESMMRMFVGLSAEVITLGRPPSRDLLVPLVQLWR